MPIERATYTAEWRIVGASGEGGDGALRMAEPTREELGAHAASLAGFYNEPVNRALLTNETDHSPADVIEHFEDMWAAGERPFLLYRGGLFVGDADLRNVEDDRAEYAILVGPRDTQARGLGTRFTIMALAIAFGPLGLRRVYASIRPNNAGSLRMFEKVGFARDESPEARVYAEAPDDVCVSMEQGAFHRAHAAAAAEIRVRSIPAA